MEGTRTYLCRRTGESVTVSNDDLRAAEEIEEEEIEKLSDWRRENMRIAFDIVEHFDDYEALPSSFEVNEYEMIEDFCYTVRNGRNKEILLNAISGRGAFGRFKDSVRNLGIEEEWYRTVMNAISKLQSIGVKITNWIMSNHEAAEPER